SPVAAIGDALRNPGGEEPSTADRATVEEGGALPVAVPVEEPKASEAAPPKGVAVADPSAPGHLVIEGEGVTATGLVPTRPPPPPVGAGRRPPAPGPPPRPGCFIAGRAMGGVWARCPTPGERSRNLDPAPPWKTVCGSYCARRRARLPPSR